MPIDLIDHKTWMDQTSLFARIRSTELKRVDDAIAAYNRTKSDDDLRKLRQYFEAWKLKEGVGWRNSPRNVNRTFDKLEDQLNPRAATGYTNELALSRKGLLYLFGKTEIELGVVETLKIVMEGGAKMVKDAVELPGSLLTKQDAKITGYVAKGVTMTATGIQKISNEFAPKGPSSGIQPLPVFGPENAPPGFFQKILDYFKAFVTKIWETMKAKARDFWMESGWEKGVDIWNLCAKVAKLIVGQVAKAAVPFLSGAIDIVNGVGDTVKHCYNRYQAYSLGKGVELNSGHPGVVADSIKLAMDLGIGKGLYATFKGAADITAAAFTGGASTIIMFVVNGCEILAKLIHRIWEIVGMRAFFSAAKDRYAKGEAGYADAHDFTAWYRAGAYSLPCLSALAINSGITGDKMMYLTMFTDRSEREVISQAQFNRGVEYMDHLKEWSRKYLSDAGYEFKSNDGFVQAILNSATGSKPVLTELQLA